MADIVPQTVIDAAFREAMAAASLAGLAAPAGPGERVLKQSDIAKFNAEVAKRLLGGDIALPADWLVLAMNREGASPWGAQTMGDLDTPRRTFVSVLCATYDKIEANELARARYQAQVQ